MRPLRLCLEGFTCFKERQVLELRHLDLFAITGPTGAGKTSLLDAMLFALYGRIPRMRRSYAEFISLGRDRMSVILEFSVGPRTFRVGRAGHRTRAPTAVLEEVVDGRERSVATGVREVDRAIQELLGLPYEAFTQAVVLPQGEFATFLKSPPRERREILRNLLRLGVYERMRQLAQEERQVLEGRRSALLHLCGDYADATPEAVEAQERELGRARREQDELRRQWQGLQDRLHQLTEAHRRTKELEAVRERERALIAQQPQIEAAERTLERAQRAHSLLPLVELAGRAEQAATEQEVRATDARSKLQEAQAAHARATGLLREAEERARQIPALRERIRALDELRGVVEAVQAARGRAEGLHTRLAQITSALREKETERLDLSREEARLARDVETAERELEGIGYDEGLDARLEEVRERAEALARLREDLARAGEEAASAERAASQAEERAALAGAALAQARERWSEAKALLEEAQAELGEAHRRHAAAHLRASLRPGEPCPVCGQSVRRVPPAAELPELERLKRAAEQAAQEEEAARIDLERAAAERSAAEATSDQARLRLEEVRNRTRALMTRIAEETECLERAVGEAVATEAGETIEARIRSAVRRIVQRRRTHLRVLRRLETARSDLIEAHSRAARVEEQIASLRAEQAAVAEQLAAAEREVRSGEARIRQVTTRPDVEREREELEEEIRRIEVQLARAQAEEVQAATLVARHEAIAREVEGEARRAREEAESQRARALEAARGAGFPDLEAVRAASLPPAEVERLRQLVETYWADRRSVARELQALEREVGGSLVTDEELERARADCAAAEDAHQEAVARVAALEARLAELRNRVERARELRSELEHVEAQYTLYRQLSDDLRSENFQEFVLEEAFRELVAGASVRLMELTQRYTLEYGEDGRFAVVDHDNAGERRSADTLSGGETFLASLALALELSAQVQRASGAVVLESLFIDEGFGTLDPETLDGVAGAIESLQTGGRMVGIITHLQDLSARLPSRVVVEKRPEGSRIRVEVD